ncbi:hypothetical protein P3X46_015910 [Hevea brasiliensis]|uniref:fructose-bisphosphate aldolase n=1 Tax=Hevea brasiliensis TaxID=3981 RepID=A0ABQ9LYU5_HEVBR|nr:hypothetical protein P3X46_015910 [Hevea brasiliensis]
MVRCHPVASSALCVRSSSYADELVKTAKTIASPGRGVLAMDESNATCGKRLASAYRTLLVTAPGLGQCVSSAILFEETLYQSTTDGKKMVDVLVEQNIVPGIKVDKMDDERVLPGLVPLVGSNDESWCQGLDGLASRSAHSQWRPSAFAVKEAAWGLAREGESEEAKKRRFVKGYVYWAVRTSG